MQVTTIAVIGAGTMGRGIAYAAALGGFHTILEDVSPSVLDRGMAWIIDSFEEGVKRGKVEPSVRDAAMARIRNSSTVEDAIRDAELIIEAVPEEIEMKVQLFAGFDKLAKPGAILPATLPHSRLPISLKTSKPRIAALECIFSIPCQKCGSWKLCAPRKLRTPRCQLALMSPSECTKKQ